MTPKLAALIEAARSHKMTPEELEAQRRSWVRGELGLGSDADEAAYTKALSEGDTDTIARLKAEGEARIEAAGL